MIAKIATKIRVDRTNRMMEDLMALTKKVVLVGVPEENNSRKGEGRKIGNAALAFIHDKGSPLQNIPARPFMEPGIRAAQEKINWELMKVARAQLDDKQDVVDRHLNRAGIMAMNNIRRVINEGIGFAPLKRGTLLGRLRRRKSYRKWSLEKKEAVMATFHPLVDTGQLRNSITYVLLDTKKGTRQVGRKREEGESI